MPFIKRVKKYDRRNSDSPSISVPFRFDTNALAVLLALGSIVVTVSSFGMTSAEAPLLITRIDPTATRRKCMMETFSGGDMVGVRWIVQIGVIACSYANE